MTRFPGQPDERVGSRGSTRRSWPARAAGTLFGGRGRPLGRPRHSRLPCPPHPKLATRRASRPGDIPGRGRCTPYTAGWLNRCGVRWSRTCGFVRCPNADGSSPGAAPDGGRTRPCAEVHARSGGNPYLSLELARGDPGGDLTDDLRAVLLARLRAAGPSAALVVAAAGLLVSQVPPTPSIAQLRVGTVKPSGRRATAVCSSRCPKRRVVGRPPIPLSPRWPMPSFTVSERRRLHTDLAAALESSLSPEPSAARLAEAAENHLLAGNADDVLASAVRAGGRRGAVRLCRGRSLVRRRAGCLAGRDGRRVSGPDEVRAGRPWPAEPVRRRPSTERC